MCSGSETRSDKTTFSLFLGVSSSDPAWSVTHVAISNAHITQNCTAQYYIAYITNPFEHRLSLQAFTDSVIHYGDYAGLSEHALFGRWLPNLATITTTSLGLLAGYIFLFVFCVEFFSFVFLKSVHLLQFLVLLVILD